MNDGPALPLGRVELLELGDPNPDRHPARDSGERARKYWPVCETGIFRSHGEGMWVIWRWVALSDVVRQKIILAEQ